MTTTGVLNAQPGPTDQWRQHGLRESEKKILKDAKAEFDYVTNPDNCGKVVRNHFDGIVFSLYGFIFLFLVLALGGIYVYTRHQKTYQNPVVHESTNPSTQPP